MQWDDLKQYDSLTEKDHLDVKIIAMITTERIKRNWSQNELSKQTGVSKSTISKMENSVAIPRLESLIKICDALDLKISIEPKDK